jgi:HSP20 family molecular chaperone IbpA
MTTQATPLATRETTREIVFTPRVDILEKEDELVVLADLPGVKADDVEVKFERGELTLHAKCSPRWTGRRGLQTEYGIGDFWRTFTVSEEIDSTKISAELRNGVLTLHLPKIEQVKPRKIAVKGE